MVALSHKYGKLLEDIDTVKLCGRVTKVVGLVIEADGPPAKIGEVCLIRLPGSGTRYLRSEVVGFREGKTLLMPIGGMHGIAPGCEVIATGAPLQIPVGDALLGRVLNGVGEPIDGKGPIVTKERYSVFNPPPHPLKRPRIKEVLPLGIKAIDATLTFGKGQRVGIFSGSGVGKSTMMGMIARFTQAELNVIGLIGERGREVRDFIERDLGEDGMKRSCLVVATNDQPPLVRLRGAFVATAIAEYFRDKGRDVMLMMDSITRFARAQREIGLAIGEPPAQRGFTPSVFELLPKLLERSGTSDKGTITAIYTILVDADDMNEPIADNVRAILDGHIVLSRDLAHRNHYPAIDVLESVSRLMIEIVTREHDQASRKLREVLATIRDAQDLIDIGAYVKGSNPKIDYAITMIDKVNEFLVQGIFEPAEYEKTINMLLDMFREGRR